MLQMITNGQSNLT